MSNGNSPLAKADAGAKKKDTGAQKGEIKQKCKEPHATLVVNVKREGDIPPDNFFNDILVQQGKTTKASGGGICEKAYEFRNLKPGSYDVGATPALSGSGYTLRKIETVTLAENGRQEVTLSYIPNEIVEVKPNDKKLIKQYVNLKENSKDLRWGNNIEVSAHLKKKEKDVRVYWAIELHKDNGKYTNTVINAGNHKCKYSKAWVPASNDWTSLGGDETTVAESLTDDQGVAKIKVKLGWFGGNKYRVIASLCSKPTHPSAKAKKSDEFEVWRKHYFQLSYLKDIAIHSRNKAIASFEKVFLASDEYDEKKFEKKDIDNDKHFRPLWQCKPNSNSNDAKLIVGTHNVNQFKRFYVNPSQDRQPKSHVIFCDYQCDAKNTPATEWMSARFFGKGTPIEKVVKAKATGVADHLVCIFNPPLQGGDLIVDSSWKHSAWDAKSNNWVVKHKGVLQDNSVEIRSNRASNRDVVIKAPTAGKCLGGAGGCPCGGAATSPVFNATNVIDVWVSIKAADGTYLGWAPSKPHAVVVNFMNSDDCNDVINHEIGHLFGQTPTAGDATNAIPAHPKEYQQRGGSGSHCAEGATFTANLGASPQLDPTKAGELDAQGRASGTYSGGTCIMFGIGNAGKREFCTHCAMCLRAMDLSAFV